MENKDNSNENFNNSPSKPTDDAGVSASCLGRIISFITFFLVLIVYLLGVKNNI